jgi:DNA repair/transcription protein MET18/MMS19
VADKFKQETVLPYRRQVVKKLVIALDDGKREVRSAAVKCRAKWLGVDDEDDD